MQIQIMKTIEVYDPPMCCSTGVCGTDVDPKIVQFAGDLSWLKQQGVNVERFNLAQQPAAFAGNAAVREALVTRGNESLPILLVDGRIATSAIYPTRDQLAALAGISDGDCCGGTEEKSEGCCGGSSCCS
jgi:hypothetical protein